MPDPRTIRISDHEQYTLGDCLGRGAFGSVYRGLNTHSGETVAVKQIKLKNMLEAEAKEIMIEIDLLKNLNHANIVKYHCFYKSIDSLYIVLEYCENGSLASICKSFGVFPEHLVAVYIDQVLLGLVYLHDQGVIHRDIKGANILTTKDGTVKLADFGVATNVLSDMTVVGSPYWMAPEVIELAGATSASDIWSLGCVIIELLQGRPPYSDLDQMSALFHIVDDEHPPFPEAASPGARDFLIRCFQKNPNLRTSAKKLRKHNWITNHVKNGSQRVTNSTKVGTLDFDDAVISVQEYNEKVNGPDIKSRVVPRRSKSPQKILAQKPSRSSGQSRGTQIEKHIEVVEEDGSKDLEFKTSNAAGRAPLRLKKALALTRHDSKQDDASWDEDFVVAEPINQAALLKRHTRSPTRQSLPAGSSMRHNLPELQKASSELPLSRRRSPDRHIKDDLTIRPSSSQLARAMNQPSSASPGRRPLEKDRARTVIPSPLNALTPQRMQRSQTNFEPAKAGPLHRPTIALQHFADDKEDYSDIFGEDSPATPTLTQKFGSGEYSNRSWLDEDEFGDDPFADIEEFEKENLTTNIVREQKARAVQQMEQVLKQFQRVSKDETKLLQCIQEIQNLMNDHPDLKSTVVSSHGLLPLLEVLEGSADDELTLMILQIINTLALHNEEVQENISFVGGIASVTKYAYKRYSHEIRTQSAVFVRQILASSDLNAQIFVSCQGLAILTEFLEEDFYESRILVNTGIEGILRVFSLQGKYTPKNDLCRIMARTGVLEPLTQTLHSLISGVLDAEEQSVVDSILKIMLTFAQADEYVKRLISTRTVLKRLLMDLQFMKSSHLISALKFVKSLSSVTSTLEVLHNTNAIERLVQLLSDTSQSTYQEAANQILSTLFNLCRIDKVRQYEAASVGLVPILKRIVADERPLKDMALPMLCNMAHNKECRRILWAQRGLETYLKILSDPFWQVNAFEAIVVWFFEEPARVEKNLVEPPAVHAIIAAFGSARAVPFESFLDQLQKLLKASKRLSKALNIPKFMDKLLERLVHPKPTVRANLLKILQSVLDSSSDKEVTLAMHFIVQKLRLLAETDGAVIVRALATSILSTVSEHGGVAHHAFFDAKEEQSWEKRMVAAASKQSGRGEIIGSAGRGPAGISD